jgi:hypothetical protein
MEDSTNICVAGTIRYRIARVLPGGGGKGSGSEKWGNSDIKPNLVIMQTLRAIGQF